MIVRLLRGIFLLGLAASPMAAELGERDFVAFARIEGAGDVIPIGTAAAGTVAEVHVKEGDRVAKGDVLVQIACRALHAEVRQRNAEAAAAEAVLARVRHGARDEEVAIAMAAVKVWEARAEEAERAHQRLLSLAQGIASRARLQEIERDLKTSAAQLLEARARLRMLQAGARGEDVIEAEARRAAAAAAVDQAQARLDECTVRAPVDGTVLMTNVTPGQFVKDPTALVPLLKMVDDRILRVRAEIDEQDLQKILSRPARPGDGRRIQGRLPARRGHADQPSHWPPNDPRGRSRPKGGWGYP